MAECCDYIMVIGRSLISVSVVKISINKQASPKP